MTLEITHGAVRRGRRTVLEAGHITAAVPSAVGIIGINGSGKSSLFMQLTDTLASRGSAAIRLSHRPATLAYVPQVPALPGWLRVEQVADLYGLRYGILVEAMPGLYLSEIARQRASALSIGQRQALVIALALGRHADATLLDEPFAALDFRRRIGVHELLRQRCDEGGAILLSSQAAADLIGLCDRFAVIRDGIYVFNGSRTELGGHGDDSELEKRLLQLLTMPVPTMEVPLRRR